MLRLVCLFLGCNLLKQLLLKLLSSTYNDRLVYCFHHVLLGNWNSREMETGAGMEHGNGNLQKSLLFIGFFTSEVHKTV